MRKIGRMGERFFGIWCDSVNLTANGSEVDETGWDFFVEFPSSSSRTLPRDIVQAPIECKVQVKSTDYSRNGESIALSNLERLVKAKLPAFFCFIEFDGKNTPQAVYLVHVGKEIIEKTLKRIRELYIKGEEDKLNKHTIRIKYKECDRLPDVTGESLKNAIETFIPKTLSDYILEKEHLLKTLGFENGVGQVTFHMSGSDPVRNFIDLLLGLRDEVYIDKSIGYDKRFSLLSENPMLSFDTAILTMETRSESVTLKFKEHEFSPGVTLEAKLYRCPLPLPQNYIKFRIKSVIFDLIFEPFKSEANLRFLFNFREDTGNCLSDLKGHLRVLTLLKKTSNSSILEIICNRKELPKISLPINVKDEIDDWSDIFDIAEMASQVCQRFSILEDEVFVTLDELIMSSQPIKIFHYILHANPDKECIDFYARSDEYKEGQKLACVFSVMATIGNHTVSCFCAIIGSLSLTNIDQYRLVAESISHGNEIVVIGKKMIEQSIIDERFDDFEEKLRGTGLKTIRIPLNDLLS